LRLSPATLDRASDAERFAYDRDAYAIGIVHFGIGAFHRAHQAWYTDRAMDSGDRDWLISGVSLRSADVAMQLGPQSGLYTVAERSAAGTSLRIVGAVREVFVGACDAAAITRRIAAAATQIVSFTITEKGYCRAPDGTLDARAAGPGSVYAFIANGLSARRKAGLPGLTLLSCDNLADNGRQLERLVGDYCAMHDPDLGRWIADNCTFPATMVDRIVPATTTDDRAVIAAALGLDDAATVMTEPFSQWVIEDRFAGPRPAWHRVGVELVSDVAPYESAKLRMLNGAHSALAYLGLQRGYVYVHEATADPALRAIVERLMRVEAAPTITAAPGQDLARYAAALLVRFANPALEHRLSQIATDGSQKIPQRWLDTLAWHQRRGGSCPAILTALNAWLAHLRGDNGPVDDPMAAALAAIIRSAGATGAPGALFGPSSPFATHWIADDMALERVASRSSRSRPARPSGLMD
jgi:fructuronate reductase